MKRLLIAYIIGNFSAKKCQNPFMCVVCQSYSKPKVGRFLRHGVVLYTHHTNAGGAWWRPRSNGRHNDFNKNWQI